MVTCYKDRNEAGKVLSSHLQHFKDQQDVVVLAMPRGGVPIAYEIAEILNLPMDLFLVRKLGVPGYEELAMGAIGENNSCVLNKDLILQLGINEQQINQVKNKEQEELQRRIITYRQGKPLTNIENKIVILVDDGIATGATMEVAINTLASLKPKAIIVAVPVASKESIMQLSPLVDEIICPLIPDNFEAVGAWYHAFPQVSDNEVINLVNKKK